MDWPFPVTNQEHFFVDKTLLQMNLVEDSLDLHPVSSFLLDKPRTLFKSGIGTGCFISSPCQLDDPGCHGACSREIFGVSLASATPALDYVLKSKNHCYNQTHKFCGRTRNYSRTGRPARRSGRAAARWPCTLRRFNAGHLAGERA